MSDKPLTGRTVFLFTAGAFAIVIGVNLLLAVKAVSTFPGLEVKNGYVASQRFDAERAEQEALGWRTAVHYGDGVLRLEITGPDGRPVAPATLSAVIGRPTTRSDDRELAFAASNGILTATETLAPGNWNLDIRATAANGSHFRQRLVLHVKAGE